MLEKIKFEKKNARLEFERILNCLESDEDYLKNVTDVMGLGGVWVTDAQTNGR